MIRQQIELSLKYFPFIVSQFLRREKKFCKTELLNDLILKEWFLQSRKHHHDFQLMQASTETLGSKLSHGTSSKFADVRTHLRKVSKMLFLLSQCF